MNSKSHFNDNYCINSHLNKVWCVSGVNEGRKLFNSLDTFREASGNVKLFPLWTLYFPLIRCTMHLLCRITANITILDNNVKAFLSIFAMKLFLIFLLHWGKIFPFYHVTIFCSFYLKVFATLVLHFGIILCF